jgi:hypothetical protein
MLCGCVIRTAFCFVPCRPSFSWPRHLRIPVDSELASSACFPLNGLRSQAFVTYATAVFVHGGVRTLATAANANGHLVSSDVLRRQNLNVGVRRHLGDFIVHPDAPKAKIAPRDRTRFSANKMISESWKNFRPGLERQNLKNQIGQRRRPNEGVG